MEFLIRTPGKFGFTGIEILKEKAMGKSDWLNVPVSTLLISVSGNKNGQSCFKWENNEQLFLFLGDVIVPHDFKGSPEEYYKQLITGFTGKRLQEMRGFFYIIRVQKKEKSVEVFSSLFGILPVYYSLDSRFLYVSSRFNLIKENSGETKTLDKRFVLEKVLFNYPVFNHTYLNEIKTLPTNASLRLVVKANDWDQKIVIEKHTEISDYFSTTPRPWKKCLAEAADFFLETCKNYFPAGNSYISFTSGFDGRTLTAAALKFEKPFTTYAFGAPEADDLVMPSEQAKKLNMDFVPILLDENYIKNDFLTMGTELIGLSEGNSSLSRAHYLHAARTLAGKTEHILTGNFGSELLRSFHLTGVMISAELAEVFKTNSLSIWREKLNNSSKMKVLASGVYDNEMEQLIVDLEAYKKQFDSSMPLNQQFYKFIFDEVFRKYFGPEITTQRLFLNNRAPYLDFQFIKHLLTTGIPGIYSSFFEHNPLERFKGQVLYAHIIKRSCKPLLFLKTGKGYKPADLIYPQRYVRILMHYLKKKTLKHSTGGGDELGVSQGIEYHLETIKSWKTNNDLFSPGTIADLDIHSGHLDRDLFSTIMSMNQYINILTNNVSQ